MKSSKDFMDFDFSGSVQQINDGLILRPLIENYLYDAKFPAFSLHFAEQQMERKPDGFFHPSTHPSWQPWALYRYLAYPETFPLEKKRFMSTLAVTFGKVWHEFIQICLTDMGILPPDWQVCTMCPPEANCHEAGFLDKELGERGHTDGLIDLSRIGRALAPGLETPNFEFKTSNDNFGKLQNVPDNDIDLFRKKWPDYYGQQQRYMRGFHRTWSIVLMMEPVFPYTMREFQIPIDPVYNQQVDEKYETVRRLLEAGMEPYCCNLKGCPAYSMCV